eukprot:s916_g27.t1
MALPAEVLANVASFVCNEPAATTAARCMRGAAATCVWTSALRRLWRSRGRYLYATVEDAAVEQGTGAAVTDRDPLGGSTWEETPAWEPPTKTDLFSGPAAKKRLFAGADERQLKFRKSIPIVPTAAANPVKTQMMPKPKEVPKKPAELKAAPVPTLREMAQKKQQKNMEERIALLKESAQDPTKESQTKAEAAMAYLQNLKHDKLKVKADESLVSYGVFVAMYESEKLPDDLRNQATDELIGALKKDDVDKNVEAALFERQGAVLRRMTGVEDVVLMVTLLDKICWTPNPKAADMKELLEAVPVTLRALLRLSAPEKYRAQKSPAWKTDLGILLALCSALALAHLETHLAYTADVEVKEEAEEFEEGSGEGTDEEEADPVEATAAFTVEED